MRQARSTLQFTDYAKPALEAGDYTLDASLQVRDEDSGTALESTSMAAKQVIRVEVSRFALTDQQVHASYPPPGSQGNFSLVLPHLVLSERALAWACRINESSHTTVYPWMALLLLKDSDVNIPQGLAKDDVSETGSFSYTVGQTPYCVSGDGDTTFLGNYPNSSKMKVIIVEKETFMGLMPEYQELPYLAHVRSTEADYSIVLGNTFPTVAADEVGQQYYVHCISLERLYSDGKIEFDTKYIQLVTLASWSFQHHHEKEEDFSKLMNNLRCDVFGKALPGKDFLFRLNFPGVALNNHALQEKLLQGYAPLPYHNSLGADTMTWQRGPLVPQPVLVQTDAMIASLNSQDLLAYDEGTAMWDTTYASAFELGRVLALNDKRFLADLMRMRNFLHLLYEQSLTGKNLIRRKPGIENAPFLGDMLSMLRGITTGMEMAAFTRATHNFSVLQARHTQQRQGGQGRSRVLQITQGPDQVRDEPSSLRVAALRAGEQKAFELRPNVQGAEEVAPVIAWLQAIINFTSMIPVRYLIPHPDLLPNESIRFFYTDKNWFNALIIGALKMCLHSERERKVTESLLTILLGPESKLSYLTFGFFIYSRLVLTYPGLVIQGVYEDEVLPPDFKSIISSNVMLCLFKLQPKEITIAAPHEQLTFGLSVNGNGDKEIPLRDGEGKPLDARISYQELSFRENQQTLWFRRQEGGDLVSVMRDKLSGTVNLDENDASKLALQMTQPAKYAKFGFM